MPRVGDSPRNTPTPPPEREQEEPVFTTGAPTRILSPHDITAPIGNAVQRVQDVAGRLMDPIFGALLETRGVVDSAHAAITNAPGAIADAVSSGASIAAKATFKIVRQGASQATSSALNLASAGASSALGLVDQYVAAPVLDHTTRAYFENQRKIDEYAKLRSQPDPKLDTSEEEEFVSIDFRVTPNSESSDQPLSSIQEEQLNLDESKSEG